jgi:hypothetical protein
MFGWPRLSTSRRLLLLGLASCSAPTLPEYATQPPQVVEIHFENNASTSEKHAWIDIVPETSYLEWKFGSTYHQIQGAFPNSISGRISLGVGNIRQTKGSIQIALHPKLFQSRHRASTVQSWGGWRQSSTEESEWNQWVKSCKPENDAAIFRIDRVHSATPMVMDIAQLVGKVFPLEVEGNLEFRGLANQVIMLLEIAIRKEGDQISVDVSSKETIEFQWKKFEQQKFSPKELLTRCTMDRFFPDFAYTSRMAIQIRFRGYWNTEP